MGFPNFMVDRFPVESGTRILLLGKAVLSELSGKFAPVWTTMIICATQKSTSIHHKAERDNKKGRDTSP